MIEQLNKKDLLLSTELNVSFKAWLTRDAIKKNMVSSDSSDDKKVK